MARLHLAGLLLALAACRCEMAPAGPVAITHVTVVDPGSPPSPDRTVLLAGGRIVAIRPGDAVPPPGTEIVDGRGKWLVPGYVDAHVHFHQSGGPFTRPDVVDRTAEKPYTLELARTQARLPATLRTTLAAGITSVADLGGPRWNQEVRRTATRMEAAPRVEIGSRLISTVARPALDLGDAPIVKAGSPREAAALAREEAAARPDFLKFWFVRTPGPDLAAGVERLAAVATVAEETGIPLVVHATELETAKAALRAGADVLAHSVSDRPVDAEFLALARERDVVVVSTLQVEAGYEETLAGRFEPTPLERRIVDRELLAELAAVPGRKGAGDGRPSPAALVNVRRVWNAGIPLAAGSDAGNVGTLPGGGFHRELRWLAEAGLRPDELLVAATVNGARVLGREDELGRIRPGFRADLVLLDADPRTGPAAFAAVDRVFRDGRPYAPEALRRPAE